MTLCYRRIVGAWLCRNSSSSRAGTCTYQVYGRVRKLTALLYSSECHHLLSHGILPRANITARVPARASKGAQHAVAFHVSCTAGRNTPSTGDRPPQNYKRHEHQRTSIATCRDSGDDVFVVNSSIADDTDAARSR